MNDDSMCVSTFEHIEQVTIAKVSSDHDLDQSKAIKSSVDISPYHRTAGRHLPPLPLPSLGELPTLFHRQAVHVPRMVATSMMFGLVTVASNVSAVLGHSLLLRHVLESFLQSAKYPISTLRWAWGRTRPQSTVTSGVQRSKKNTMGFIFCENYTIWVYLIFQYDVYFISS